jgi:hypothetical protein
MGEKVSLSDKTLMYLLEYGWAVLIIIVIVAFLYSTSIFTSPENNIPSKVFDYEEACQSLSNLFAENSNCTLKRGKVGDAVYVCYCCFNLPDVNYRFCNKYNLEIMEEGEIE